MTHAHARLLADIRKLAPQFSARAAEFEAARRIPRDVVETLRSIGVFRMLSPRSHDGLELELPDALEVLTTLSRIDGSLGWTAMIGSGTAIFAPLLPTATYEQLYSNGPDIIYAASATPAGTAAKVQGGWQVTGRWPFASGCAHAEWIFGVCVVTEDGKPVPGPAGKAGPPKMRVVALPAQQWQIEDTWYAAGLKGTASHHVALRGVVVSEGNFFDFPEGPSCQPGPLYQSVLHMLPLMHAAFHVGAAEGAVDELVMLAKGGRQQLRAAVPLQDSEIFQYELGRAAADVRAARAAFEVQVASHWRHALAYTLKDPALLIEGTQTAVWIANACDRVAHACFALAGGSAVYDSSPLQRRLRDLYVASQHAAVQQRHYADAGKLLLGKTTTGG